MVTFFALYMKLLLIILYTVGAQLKMAQKKCVSDLILLTPPFLTHQYSLQAKYRILLLPSLH